MQRTKQDRLAVLLIPILLFAVGIEAARADDELDRGKELYIAHCRECHGDTGAGDGEKAERLGFRARDFRLGAFKCRCTPTGSLPTDDDLLRSVSRGLRGSAMRGFKDVLTETELRSVVTYIKSLAPIFSTSEAPACIEIPEPIPATPETVAEGEQVYRLLRCWNCHGVAGRGDGPAAKGLLDEFGKRIRVYDFTRANRFKCGGEDRELFRLFHTGVTGSPMPSFSSALAFPADATGDPAALVAPFGAEALGDLVTYLAPQPDSAELSRLSEGERKELANRRTWALIHYLRSLTRR